MDTLKHEIKQLIITSLALEDITAADIGDDMELFGDGLGLDSIDALELGIALRKKYNLQLESGNAGNREHFRTVNRLAHMVKSNRGEGVGEHE